MKRIRGEVLPPTQLRASLELTEARSAEAEGNRSLEAFVRVVARRVPKEESLEKKRPPKPQPGRFTSQKERGQQVHPRVDEERTAIGLNCIRCGLPLQITASATPDVLASLERTGLVFLLCVCGQLQLVGFSQRTPHD